MHSKCWGDVGSYYFAAIGYRHKGKKYCADCYRFKLKFKRHNWWKYFTAHLCLEKGESPICENCREKITIEKYHRDMIKRKIDLGELIKDVEDSANERFEMRYEETGIASRYESIKNLGEAGDNTRRQ